MLESTSEASCQALKADSHLTDWDKSCWSAHVSKAFSGMSDVDMFNQKMMSACSIPMQYF